MRAPALVGTSIFVNHYLPMCGKAKRSGLCARHLRLVHPTKELPMQLQLSAGTSRLNLPCWHEEVSSYLEICSGVTQLGRPEVRYISLILVYFPSRPGRTHTISSLQTLTSQNGSRTISTTSHGISRVRASLTQPTMATRQDRPLLRDKLRRGSGT